ncbi:Mitosis inhibitor protein kinase mik1 [Cytospora mali]|uniref:Mitosis inhibitor protein kinase mik1 n=1 Tax=Cytospora mali TaxID=578113 RepID=A0A194VKI4_CYTMA|nr:Mitosis inhibitor protein kinase mik1 [Valsa mali]
MAFFDIGGDEIEAMLQEPEADLAELQGCEEVVKRCKSLGSTWYDFWASVKSVSDPDQIWYNLCEGGAKQAQAIRLCQKFLSIYATHRKRYRVSLGPTEMEAERTVRSARTILNIWRHLVFHFNRTVLVRKRQEDPANAARWNLGFKEGLFTQKGVGPVYEIVRWIGAQSEKMGLSRDRLFEKKEATAEDIALILQTLWRRAEDIPCTPLTRLSFHAMLLLAAIGGFRPGVVENIKYRQVSIQMVRDPKTQEIKLVVTFTVQQNKQRLHAIKTDQRDVLNFSVVFVPYNLFCPASLAIARGISENAFDPPFDSAEDLLERPLMEKHVQSIQLPWKKDLREKEIFPISYREYWDIFTRTLLVAGYPKSIRPYAVRVGAGSRLDGVLTPAFRNYLFSHSSSMFERSYQPRHVKQDLLSLLAPEAQAEDAGDLFRILRNSSLQCDPLAPIDVSQEDIVHWKNTREDMRGLLSSNDYKKSTRVRVLVKKLSRAHITGQRRQYFEESNRRRALGQTTDDLHTVRPKLRTSRGGESLEEAITQHFQHNSDSDDPPDPGHKLSYLEMLVAYLRKKPQIVPTCFICCGENTLQATGSAGEGVFNSWQEVWKHSNKAHRSTQMWPLPCPECNRLGYERSYQIANLGEWCSHVHEHHAPRDKAPYRCLLGCQTFANQTALREHLINCHYWLWVVVEPFPCPECCRLGLEKCIISDSAEWRRHIESHHDPKLLPPMTKASNPTQTVHRCLLCIDKSYPTKTGLSLHNTNIHVKGDEFASPFPCPECRRLAKVDSIISDLNEWCNHIQNREEWVVHCAAVHRDVSGVALAHSMVIARKQTEMNRLALLGDNKRATSEAEVKKQNESEVGHARAASREAEAGCQHSQQTWAASGRLRGNKRPREREEDGTWRHYHCAEFVQNTPEDATSRINAAGFESPRYAYLEPGIWILPNREGKPFLEYSLQSRCFYALHGPVVAGNPGSKRLHAASQTTEAPGPKKQKTTEGTHLLQAAPCMVHPFLCLEDGQTVAMNGQDPESTYLLTRERSIAMTSHALLYAANHSGLAGQVIAAKTFKIKPDRGAQNVAKDWLQEVKAYEDIGCHDKSDMCACTDAAFTILSNIADALQHVHAVGFTHNDLKPGNIVYHPARGAFLIDFGMGTEAAESARQGGTPWYLPAEYLAHKKRGTPADIFALGVTMLWVLRKCSLPEKRVEWMIADLHAHGSAAALK